MDMFLKAEQQNINNVLNTFDFLKEHTGFTINYDKPRLYRIGSLENSKAEKITKKQVVWTCDPINVLGIWVDYDQSTTQDLNYVPLIEKAKQITKSWTTRHLSLLGKVEVINTLIGSMFVYRMTVLPNMDDKYIKILNNIFTNFLWDGRKSKIPLRVLTAKKDMGGLGLFDLGVKELSLKATWVQILANDEKLANLAYQELNPIMREWIFECNLRSSDVKHIEINDPFWRNVLEAWCTYHYKAPTPEDIDVFIWYNSDIRIESKPFLWGRCFKCGLCRLSQLYENGQVITPEQAKERFDMEIMQLNALLSAVPKSIKSRYKTGQKLEWKSRYSELLDCKTLSRKIYKTLKNENPRMKYLKEKWSELLLREIDEKEVNTVFNNIYKTTNIAKYRSFQYRLLHNALVTNKTMYKWGMIDSPHCSFCHYCEENIIHLFVTCPVIAKLWDNLTPLISTFTNEGIEINIETVLFDRVHPKPGHVINFICLVTKQYIYRQRCQKKLIDIKGLKGMIYQIENMEKYIAIKKGNLKKHHQKWGVSKEFAFQKAHMNEYISQ